MANVYREFPALDGVPAYMMARLILEARLSPKDVQIAASRLIWANGLCGHRRGCGDGQERRVRASEDGDCAENDARVAVDQRRDDRGEIKMGRIKPFGA